VGLPPLPSGWVEAQRQIHVELVDGEKSVWKASELPANSTITLRQKTYKLNAYLKGTQVHVELNDAP
jgi:hypothetical protein